MKKFLVAVIFIIPIIVMAALSLTGTIIASATPVNAREIKLRDSNNSYIDSDTIITVEPGDFSQFIIVDILPSITYDDSIVYHIDDSIDKEERGAVRLERQGDSNRYTIVPVSSGVARVIVSPRTNIHVSKAFTVIVLGREIKEINLFNEDGLRLDSLELLSPQRLFANIHPIEALVREGGWHSGNEKIVRVSKSGMLYPISRGITTVHFTATDKDGRLHDKQIAVDTTRAIVKNSLVYTSGQINTSWVENNLLLEQNARISELEEGRFLVEGAYSSTEVRVLPKTTNEWGFVDNIGTVYTNNGKYFVRAGYLDFNRFFEELDCTYTSSNPLVAKVLTGGEVVPISEGEVMIAAHHNGEKKEIKLVVRCKPSVFNLKLNSEDNKLGIKQDRIWGNIWYNDNMEFTNSYEFGARTAGIELQWEVSDNSLATIDQNAIITFHPESAGQEIVVTATMVVHNHITKIKRSYVFKMHPEGTETINVKDSKEFYAATNQRGYNIVLQNDIEVDEGVRLSASLYGNGFMIDASNRQEANHKNNVITVDQSEITNPEKTIIIEDIVMEGAEGYDSSEEKGTAICIYSLNTPIILRYAIVQYFTTACYAKDAADLTLEGCIMGDCFFTSLNLTYSDPIENRVTLRNNILKNTGGPCIFIANYHFEFSEGGYNVMPYINIEGFLDIYNWKTPRQVSGILSGMDREVLKSVEPYINVDNLIREIGNMLVTLFEREDYRHLTYYHAPTKESYISLGMFVIGIFNELEPQRLYSEDEGLTLLELTLPYKDGSQTGLFIEILEGIANVLGFTLLHPSYILSYDFEDGSVPRNKPGDPVPQSSEIFERLRNG